nr:hypothetical protein [Tanacetum cinerariifolium]
MSDSKDSTVTYTEVSSPFEGLSDIGSLGVKGPPMMPEDPYAYVVATFQAPPSPDYVPGPKEPEQAPPLPEFVPEPVYLEFMPPEDEIIIGNKMHKAFPLPVINFPLAEEVSTASVEGCHCQKKSKATARKIALLSKEVIEFGDSYVVPANTTDTTGGDKSGRTLTLTAEDMQRKKNDVKARTTLPLSLPDEHQMRFSKYKTARELWAAILKTFGEIEQDDLNQKFLTSLALEWLMHTIVWRNKSDLDTMSLDDLYNHLKVYESEVQKKSEQNSQNMAFISSTKHSSINEDGNTASVATISQDTACAYIASQSNGSQIKFDDINQIDEDDMEEMDIKWNMALLSMRADKFWKKTCKKISIQGSDVVGFDKSK